MCYSKILLHSFQSLPCRFWVVCGAETARVDVMTRGRIMCGSWAFWGKMEQFNYRPTSLLLPALSVDGVATDICCCSLSPLRSLWQMKANQSNCLDRSHLPIGAACRWSFFRHSSTWKHWGILFRIFFSYKSMWKVRWRKLKRTTCSSCSQRSCAQSEWQKVWKDL